MSSTDTIGTIETQWLVSIFAENVTNIQINLKSVFYLQNTVTFKVT